MHALILCCCSAADPPPAPPRLPPLAEVRRELIERLERHRNSLPFWQRLWEDAEALMYMEERAKEMERRAAERQRRLDELKKRRGNAPLPPGPAGVEPRK